MIVKLFRHKADWKFLCEITGVTEHENKQALQIHVSKFNMVHLHLPLLLPGNIKAKVHKSIYYKCYTSKKLGDAKFSV